MKKPLLDRIQDLEEELLELKKNIGSYVDWSLVKVDTPILVRNDEESIWQPAYFGRYDAERCDIYASSNGTTSRTGRGGSKVGFAKLDINAPSIINWIPNDGIRPNCERVIIIREDGVRTFGCPNSFQFKKGGRHIHDIASYAIIE